MKNKLSLEDKQYLKKLLRKGKFTVYVVQRSVSASGMTRKLDLFTIVDRRLHYITGYVARALEWSLDKNGHLIVHGAGMDMHFHTVYSLSAVLYGYKNDNAYKLRKESI